MQIAKRLPDGVSVIHRNAVDICFCRRIVEQHQRHRQLRQCAQVAVCQLRAEQQNPAALFCVHCAHDLRKVGSAAGRDQQLIALPTAFQTDRIDDHADKTRIAVHQHSMALAFQQSDRPGSVLCPEHILRAQPRLVCGIAVLLQQPHDLLALGRSHTGTAMHHQRHRGRRYARLRGNFLQLHPQTPSCCVLSALV